METIQINFHPPYFNSNKIENMIVYTFLKSISDEGDIVEYLNKQFMEESKSPDFIQMGFAKYLHSLKGPAVKMFDREYYWINGVSLKDKDKWQLEKNKLFNNKVSEIINED